METIQASFDHLAGASLMGEARNDAVRPDFGRKLKLEFHGTEVTSDSKVLACRELAEALLCKEETD